MSSWDLNILTRKSNLYSIIASWLTVTLFLRISFSTRLRELLYQGNIVAWFQGRAEFGPRSLGARSILASPLLVHMKENLNLFVKHRETSSAVRRFGSGGAGGRVLRELQPTFEVSAHRIARQK